MQRPEWQTRGVEPDYRFTLANERTFLAWIRTALAVLASGVLLDQLAQHGAPGSVTASVAGSLIVLGAALAACSYFRWKGNEIATRNSEHLPTSPAIPLLVAALGCAGAAIFVGLLVKLW